MTLSVAFGLLLQAVFALTEAATKPHIIFIMADDLGSNDVGWHDSSVLSPELNELAADGVELPAMYTYSWCAPSRGQFLSGRYAPHTGFTGSGGASKTGNGKIAVFNTKYSFIPQTLKQAGYTTLMVGKWHLGFSRSVDLPENRGFDKYLGYLQGGEDYYDRSSKVVNANCTTTKDFWFGTPGHGRPAALQKYWTGQYSTSLYADFLVKQIGSHNTSIPLFVYAAFQGIHYPLQVPKIYFDRYASQGAAAGDCIWDKQGTSSSGYPNGFKCVPNGQWPLVKPGLDCFCNRLLVKAQVSALSEAVGNVTSALKRRGMWNNTVLVFMSDNGGPLDGAHSNAPLRGGKLNFFEGGVKSGAFITSALLPSQVRGTTYKGLAHETDWYATFAHLAGIAVPQDVDGVNMWGTLQDPAKQHRTEVLITNNILISGRWKLVTGAGQHDGPGSWRIGNLKGCMLGTSGGWLVPPTNSTSMCPKDIYSSGANAKQVGCPEDRSKTDFPVTDEIDKWLCSAPCTAETPCLWDLEMDPEERHEVAKSNSKVVEDLLARLQDLQKNFNGPTTVSDNGAFCSAAEARKVHGLGLFVGPWLNEPTSRELLI